MENEGQYNQETIEKIQGRFLKWGLSNKVHIDSLSEEERVEFMHQELNFYMFCLNFIIKCVEPNGRQEIIEHVMRLLTSKGPED